MAESKTGRIELEPKCFNHKQPAFAMTNRGEVIPCCWLDTQMNRINQDYQKLLMVSNLDDYDSVDEIFLTDEWVQFYDDLQNGKGFPTCYQICRKRDEDQHKREVVYDAKTSKKINVRST
jgi:hypothetical protein